MAAAFALGETAAGLGAVAVPVGEIGEKLGAVSAAAAVAAALLLPEPRRRAMAMGAALVLAAVVLIGHIWDTEQFRSISGDVGTFLALLVVGVALVIGLAALFLRRQELFPIMAVAALPFRVPIDVAGSTSNLLVPLYLVIAGAAVAHIWRQLSPGLRLGREPASGSAAAHPVEPGGFAHNIEVRDRGGEFGRRFLSMLEVAVAAFIAIYALQSLYSSDFDTALEQMIFFYVPFALLLKLLAEVRWTRSLLVSCVAVLMMLAVLFSGIGLWEYERRELLWNPKVISANQFESYFRVNSVFWDPNIFGRFLVLVMVIVASIMLWNARHRLVLGTAAVLALLWGGLVLTLSQSSIASLLVGLGVLAALRWDPRRTAAVSAVGLALGAVVVIAFQDALRVDLGSSSGLNKATSGRAELIEGGVDLFLNRPLWGYGSGSFARTFRLERKGNQQQAVSASHTLPVTIAAEQGALGLAVYVALLVCAFRLLLGRASGPGTDAARAPPASLRRRDGAEPAVAVGTPNPGSYRALVSVALTASFATLVAHTMMYAAFLEDPFTWVILAAGLGVLSRTEGAEAGVEAEPAVEPAPAAA